MLAYSFNHQQIALLLILVAALVATLLAMIRNLPAQNVIPAALLIVFISGVIETLGVKTGIPFGPFFYTETLGPQLFHLLPWPVPVIWVVVILNSRGVARLILRPWRKLPNYGYWSIGLTCLLVVLCDASLEPFARVNHYWIWQTSKKIPAWYGAPWVNFVAWGTVTLLILGFITPWLINKKPVSRPPPDYLPLIIWLLLTLLLTIGNAAQQFWWAAGFGLATAIITTVFAWRNSRW